ncbi:stability determinant [Lysobacteraceae bacterium NML95-0200]|nr:stability determinant [Xanthomonadaceae bacterium NML95-0200]
MNTRLKTYDPLVSPFESPEAEASYDRWFRTKVQEAITGIEAGKPLIPHDQAMKLVRERIEARKATRRAAG